MLPQSIQDCCITETMTRHYRSTVRYLSQPEAPEHDDTCNSWDSTFQSETFLNPVAIACSLICKDAVAQSCFVFGTIDSNDEFHLSDAGYHTECWWTWKTYVGPHQVTSVTSNVDGTVVVAATSNGTVYLLRGTDGTLLASRKVSSMPKDFRTRTSWLKNDSDYQEEMIVIEVQYDDDSISTPDLILVSNIQGTLLNNEIPDVVAEAARQMKIQNILLSSGIEMRAMAGLSIDANSLRFLICDSEGTLAVLDYTTKSRETKCLMEDIFIAGLEQEWTLDYDVGIRTQKSGTRSFFVFSAYSSDEAAAIFWFDPFEMKTICQYAVVQQPAGTSRSKVVAIEPFDQKKNSETLHLAVATKVQSKTSSGYIQIIQILSNANALSKPHLMFTIPITTSFSTISLTTTSRPFGVRFILHGSSESTFAEFVPCEESSVAIGKIRVAVQKGEYDLADELLGSGGVEDLLQDKFAGFHPSEIALSRLRTTLTKNNIFSAKECLRRLAMGAVSNYADGIPFFVEAVNFLVSSTYACNLRVYLSGLNDILYSLESVINAINIEDSALLVEKQSEITEKRLAIQFLVSVPDIEQEWDATGIPCQRVCSVAQLFTLFVKKYRFDLATQLYESEFRSELSNNMLVTPFLTLGVDVPPRKYLPFLKQNVLPNLTSNNDLLMKLRLWVCRVADDFDDQATISDGLQASIVLLKAVDQGTKELQIKILSSFSSFSPFVEYTESSSVAVSSELSYVSDFGSTSSNASQRLMRTSWKTSSETAIPTILELSALQIGAAKVNKSSGAGTYEDDDFQLDKSFDYVEQKIIEAYCLLYARSVGLVHDLIQLRNFKEKGGVQFLVIELVRHFSSKSSNAETCLEHINVHLDKLSQFIPVNKDEALLEYARELCIGNNLSETKIKEASMIARLCTSLTVRCQLSLCVLRAALLCGYADVELFKLSRDAISWASCDSTRQSELEEAARLLHIDSIVVRYCGLGARELFRVDNPHHSVSLLYFVTKHVDKESVVADTMYLCDAFHHLSRQDAANFLMQKALVHKHEQTCLTLFEQLVESDSSIIQKLLETSIDFCCEILDECSDALKSLSCLAKIGSVQKRACVVTSRINCILGFSVEKFLCYSREGKREAISFQFEKSLRCARTQFMIIEKLQKQHSVYFSRSELMCTSKIQDFVSILVEEILEVFANSNQVLLYSKIEEAKQICNLLARCCENTSQDILAAAFATQTRTILTLPLLQEDVIQLLLDMGVLKGSDPQLRGRIQLFIAVALCSDDVDSCANRIEIMNRILFSVSLIRDWSLFSSSGKLLDSIVSFSSLLDVAYEILSRSDEGNGELVYETRQKLQSEAWKHQGSFKNVSRHDSFDGRTSRPSLHPSWYIGDGLMLPPEYAIRNALQIVRNAVGVNWCISDGFADVHSFIDSRGSHSLALRILCINSARQAAQPVAETADLMYDEFQLARASTVKLLAERSLGGTGLGITSAIIDSQLSVACLLHLPQKVAYSDYRSCIPTAVKTKNFDRLLTLANIGIVISMRADQSSTCSRLFQLGWPKQRKFFEQCKELALRANWWAILKRLNVEFDSQRFNEGSTHHLEDGKFDDMDAHYQGSLLLSMISSLSQFYNVDDVLHLCSLYAKAFELPQSIVHQYHVRWLLSPKQSSPSSDIYCGCNRPDLRSDLSMCEKLARASLRQIEHPSIRLAVLRNCAASLGDSLYSATDYERYSTVLVLQHESLNYAIDSGDEVLNSFSLESEAEDLCRRRNALAILLSVFNDHRKSERPPFSNFFSSSKESDIQSLTMCGILGSTISNDGRFDPLKPLEPVLDGSDSTTVTALAPLCHALGLPTGFVHARSLIARFQKAKSTQSPFPSFENDVLPVFNRLKSSKDKLTLATWCSSQYEGNDDDKLKCLDLVLQSSLQSSSEVEQCLRLASNDTTLENMSLKALDTLKHASDAKSSLSDTLYVKKLFQSSMMQRNHIIQKLVGKLCADMETVSKNNPELPPEALIDFLWDHGSLLSATACLDKNNAISIPQLRVLCSLVHEACNHVAEQHSHVNSGHQALRFARRWLFYGDEDRPKSLTINNKTLEIREEISKPSVVNVSEDETAEFFLDLNEIHDGSALSSNTSKSSSPIKNLEHKFISQEEASPLSNLNIREKQEISDHRAALRIAFVLAFSKVNLAPEFGVDKENNNSIDNNRRQGTQRLGLLRKLGPKVDSRFDSFIYHLCRQLLQVTFISNGAPLKLDAPKSFFIDSNSSAAVTFAMRHRALRVATILCPQEAIHQVVLQEGYLSTQGTQSPCGLRHVAFGVFVAKEIEEMLLPLPHSDLQQLCTMNFPSYARTLWRHHRDDDAIESKGRFLLLLSEMSLREKNVDTTFLRSILDEMTRQNLLRTVVLALERILEKSCGENETLLQVQAQEVYSTAVKALLSNASETFSHEKERIAAHTVDVKLLDRLVYLATQIYENKDEASQFQLSIEDIRRLCC